MNFGEKLFLLCIAAGATLVLALIPDNPKGAVESPVDWSRVTDDPGKKLTLDWMGIAAYAGAKEGGWIERNLEERFNLELTPIFMDWNGYQKRRPMMLAGGDIPDVMWNGDPLQVRNNLRNGFIMEVPHELILKYAPTYVKLLNAYGKEAWLYSQYKGHNYGVPTFHQGAMGPRIGAWRKDWLDTVGINKTPETIDEMYEALHRFRHNDPDGNGQKDTYGWSPYIGHWSVAFAEIFAAYDVLAWDFQLVDGKVVWGGIRPEAKEVLAILRRWYEEELLDPDFILNSQTSRTTENRFINGNNGYTYTVDNFGSYDLDISSSMAGKMRTITSSAVITPGAPLRNKQGQRRGRTWGGAGHVIQFGKHLENEPEKVIRVLKMFEAITVNEQLYIETRSGKRGLHWDMVPGMGVKALPKFAGADNKRIRAEEMLGENGFSTIFYYPSEHALTYEKPYRRPEAVAFVDTYRKQEWGLMNVLGKSDVVPSASRYLDDLRNWQMTVFVEMITGDRSIDSFDDYVSEWKTRGGDVLNSEANEMYKQMLDIFKRVGVPTVKRTEGETN